jgi:hypothetical protein
VGACLNPAAWSTVPTQTTLHPPAFNHLIATLSTPMPSTLPSNSTPGFPIRAILGVFKLRIGVVITFTALAGLAVSTGRAFNQYYEHDTDHADVAHQATAPSPPARSSMARSGWW